MQEPGPPYVEGMREGEFMIPAKFIQLVSNQDILYALDEKGEVWELIKENFRLVWRKVQAERE